jgi:hypothetical protein
LQVDKYAPSVQRGVAKVYGQARAPLLFSALVAATFGCRHTLAPAPICSLRSAQEAEQSIAVARAGMDHAPSCELRAELAANACMEANRICALQRATPQPALAVRCTQAMDACTSLRERALNGC